MRATHDDHTRTDHDERTESTDVGELGEPAQRHEAGERQHDDASGGDRADRRTGLRLDVRDELRQQTVMRDRAQYAREAETHDEDGRGEAGDPAARNDAGGSGLPDL